MPAERITDPPLENKIVRQKLNAVAKAIVRWALSSTSHGFPSIFRVNNTPLKLVWALTLLASIGFCAYLVVSTIANYLEYGVSTQIRLYDEADSVEFPQVSFCNLDFFATPNASNYLLGKMRERFGPNVSTIRDAIDSPAIGVADLKEFLRDVVTASLDLDFDPVTRRSFGYSLNDTVRRCAFNAKGCNMSADFAWYFDPLYGNCYKWNSGVEPLSNKKLDLKSSSRPGRVFGLRMELFIGPPRTDPTTLFDVLHPYRGIFLTISNQSTLPLAFEGFSLKPGVCTSVRLKKTFYQLEPQPYSPCVNIPDDHSLIVKKMREMNFKYRQVNCLDLCNQLYIIEQCGCYDPEVSNIFPAPPCTQPAQENCTHVAFDYFSENTYAPGCRQMCPLECNTLAYEHSQSQSDFPSRAYELALESDANLVRHFDAESVAVTYENMRQSLVCVEVLFNSFEYTLFEEKPAMSVLDLISNLGGLLGLFLGLSLLSLVELVELVVEVGLILCNRGSVDASGGEL